ncbi:hypothetical protein BC829DRAFT_446393 [Chytridium lagenaria]|nr:hypothetical protein BC829DRAFT_446393 [Chytridium lagenaria]
MLDSMSDAWDFELEQSVDGVHPPSTPHTPTPPPSTSLNPITAPPSHPTGNPTTSSQKPAAKWTDTFGDLISGSDIRELVSELGEEEESFMPEQASFEFLAGDAFEEGGREGVESVDGGFGRSEGGFGRRVEGAGAEEDYPADIDDVEMLTEDSGSLRQSMPMNRSGNLRTIRPMNGTCAL